MATKPQARIAILLSGAGSTFKNLLEHVEAGDIPAEVVVVLSDREGAKGLDFARERGIPVAIVSRKEEHRHRVQYLTSERLDKLQMLDDEFSEILKEVEQESESGEAEE